jgi:small-conductance mechanosensitive channel
LLRSRISLRASVRMRRYFRAWPAPVIIAGAAIAAGCWALGDQGPRPAASAVLNHLNAVVGWYRRLATADEAAGRPSDILYLQSARSLARQSVQFAFQSAEAEIPLLPAQSRGSKNATDSSRDISAQQQSVAKTAAATADRINQIESQIGALNARISRSQGLRRKNLISQRAELESELDLEKALQTALQKIAAFLSNGQAGQNSLLRKITDLKRSLPDLAMVPSTQPAGRSGKPEIPPAQRAAGSGVIGQASILLSQMSEMHNIDGLMTETISVRQLAGEVRAPLVSMLRTVLNQGRDMASQAPSSNAAQMQQARQNLEALTTRFKQLSSATLPLTQEMIFLDQSRADLAEWRSSLGKENGQVARSLLTRVLGILIGLGIVLALSEIWRRGTVRYIREARRRRQLLIVRRFVTGLAMVLVITLGLVTGFSSLATFAGFLTAGIAVALQTVILSMAAYFFLIGRLGVRVGDRITVSGVTGDVVDIGLVRFHMMELAGTDTDPYPTGRLVAFSNAVLFQNTPLFRRIPGAAYTWHELSVSFQRDGNYKTVQTALLDAVNSVYSEYSHDLEKQYNSIERLTDTSIPPPSPRAHINFVNEGFELVIRYPVEIQRSTDIDHRITKKVSETISGLPELKASTSPPEIRPALKG